MVRPRSFPSGWFHIVIVYQDGGLTAHHVGTFEETDTSLGDGTQSLSSGKMIIGRKSTDVNNFYTSVMVDELNLWNRSLTSHQIYNMY